MRKYPIQNETLYQTKEGWYAFRDLKGDGCGEYLYKTFQYWPYPDSDKIMSNWISATVPTPATAELFPDKTDVIYAVAENAGV